MSAATTRWRLSCSTSCSSSSDIRRSTTANGTEVVQA
jgi:hypothetical protein